ncbi:MAG: 4a-hydroxytetrahydrobiopterin dehydratase [Dehalococcoidia bacterium]|nr:4a-hydroxytetrahydrobiopterin dehydratase [Dehalococcoidia bacterium]MDP6228128.1 4a-hydroxytetrahydrobiopterin dehydratase [Dehalococcoidia bacterium]MDP7083527.1 4a-hydroxytetrahydrobiopterin dehydratase [Dehalococcoidia bacterium]MDP7199379.1 4a-hydroxytetrahydrobiopterin dehydratase [Dehalococcoidia bacterium]MDP7510025.1 4a-hydroxytetrahydrobiopterin dehydratase [Dehalococcoidia bacterium]
MTRLSAEKCAVCRRDSPPVTETEIAQLHPEAPEWQIISEDGVKKLRRVFRFAGFQQALAFTNAIGNLAEEEGHHPRLVTEIRRVEVTWWTHVIRDLHRNDFVMAAKVNHLYESIPPTRG